MSTIVLIVLGVIVFVLFRFYSDFNKDNQDLQNQSLSEKFFVIVNTINDAAFGGNGDVTWIDKRSFNLYQNGQNQIITFKYGTGNLYIIWKYKYFQKEVVHERQFNNVRNLSIFEQQKIADTMINERMQVVKDHKERVDQDYLGLQ